MNKVMISALETVSNKYYKYIYIYDKFYISLKTDILAFFFTLAKKRHVAL